MKYLLAGWLSLHGLIHLMGFLKAFELAQLPQLSQSISRPIGLLWLAATLACLLTAVWLLSGYEGWWGGALVAVTLSQVAILFSWQDARFGSLANLLILLAAGLGWAQADFVAMARREAQAMLPASSAQVPASSAQVPAGPAQELVSEAELRPLPAPVQTWLRRSGIVGKARIHSLRLRQRGEMRTAPAAAWMPVEAEQVFNVDRPGFNWLAHVQALPGIELLGRDQYLDGKGEMLIKALGVWPVADAKGPATDQGAMLRYLAETLWFPSAALAPYISWEGLDSRSARATMSYGGITASANFYFNPAGDPVRIEARRYYDRQTGATLEKWLIEADPEGFRDFEGRRIPAASQVSWLLAEGDFTWFRLRITELEYNLHP